MSEGGETEDDSKECGKSFGIGVLRIYIKKTVLYAMWTHCIAVYQPKLLDQYVEITRDPIGA